MKVTLIDRHLMRLTEISANAPTHYFCKDGEITFIVVLSMKKKKLKAEWSHDYAMSLVFGDISGED